MAKLYISEYSDVGHIVSTIPAGAEPSVDQTVTYTTSTQSATLGSGTRLVRVHTDGICSIAFAANPTATTSSKRMIAGQTEYFSIPPSQMGLLKIAAVTNT